jgi:tetratricopeptide (TPR) repeat protein
MSTNELEPEPEPQLEPEPEPEPESQDQAEMSKIFYNANINLLENNYEESLKAYIYLKEEKKIENPGLTHNIGLNCLVLKYFDRAIEFFQENKKKYPHYVLSYLTEINCYIFKTEYQKAKFFAEEFIEKFPMYPQIYFILSNLYEIFEDEDRALQVKTKGLEYVKQLNDIYVTKHYVQCYYENYTNKIYYMM